MRARSPTRRQARCPVGWGLLLAAGLAACACGKTEAPAAESERVDPGEKGRLSSEEVGRLKNLGYLDRSDEPVHPGRSGVIKSDPRSHPGYNLYTNRNLCSAVLTDHDGKPVRSWREKGCHHWANATLLPDGDLIAVGVDEGSAQLHAWLKSHYILRLSWTGERVFKRHIPAHHDIQPTPTGQLVTLIHRARSLPAFSDAAVVLDDYLSVLNADGEVLSQLSFYDSLSAPRADFALESVPALAKRGIDMIDLFHSNSVEWMHRPELSRQHPIYSKSNVLVTIRHQDAVVIFDWEERRVVWAWGQGELSGPHNAKVLENGNFLIFDNGLDRGWSRVIELDPLSRKIVWQYGDAETKGFYTASRGVSQRLPGGNTLITCSDQGRAFEVTRGGEVVWEFVNPESDRKGRRATIWGLLRLEPSLVEPLLARGDRAGKEAPRPNVLLYISDTLRADALGSYGSDVGSTPRLDRFAAEGVVFADVRAPSSWTRPSVASILTGLSPLVHGAADRDQELPEGLATVAELFRAAGYKTGMISTNPNAGSFYGFSRGFDDFVELYERRERGRVRTVELSTTADAATDRAVEWIDAAKKPFFLAILTIDPHSPYTPPARFDRFGKGTDSAADGSRQWINRRDLTEADKQRIRGFYHGEIAFNDFEFGRLLDHLEARGLVESTAVVFTSDHGEELWEHGRRGHGKTLDEEVLEVPLIARYPSRIPAGQRILTPALLIDVAPSLLDLAGLEAKLEGSGRSLFGEEPAAEASFSALELDGRRLISVRSGKWKLVRDLATDRRVLIDLGGGKERAVSDDKKAAELDQLIDRELERCARLSRTLGNSQKGAHAGPEGLSPDARQQLERLGYLQASEQ